MGNFICPLLTTDTVHCVRQYKHAPDSTWSKFSLWYRKHIFVPFNKFHFRVMGIKADDEKGGFSEGQQAFTREEDAQALLLEKGPGWYIEPLPMNGCLPDGSCSFEGQFGTDGHSIYRTGGDGILPEAVYSSEIATLQHAMARTSIALSR